MLFKIKLKKYTVNSLLFVVYQCPWIVTNREIKNLMNIYHHIYMCWL